jgi:hypothetical protein
MLTSRLLCAAALLCAPVLAQQKLQSRPAPGPTAKTSSGEAAKYVVQPGTRIPLSLINSISTKNAMPGDRVYLQTTYPVVEEGKIVIPPGSYVQGTVTEAKRPGRVKGRGALYIRFDSLTLPNGVTRDFRASINSIDSLANDDLKKKEGKIESSGNKGSDAEKIGEAGAAGTGIGALAGSAAGHMGMGAGIGAAAGAAAGLAAVLMTRGPDVVLERGSTVEMVLDRPLAFSTADVDFSHSAPFSSINNGPGPAPKQSSGYGIGMPVPY